MNSPASLDSLHVILAILVMTGITVLLRAVPFFAASLFRKYPLVQETGRFLPPVIMCLLLFSTLSDTGRTDPLSIYPGLLAVLVTAIVHVIWRQALLSIALGTGLFVLIRHFEDQFIIW